MGRRGSLLRRPPRRAPSRSAWACLPLMAPNISLLLFILASRVYSQTISTNTPVPPLQWINLTNLLQGTAHPPPLKDAAIGYDEIRYLWPTLSLPPVPHTASPVVLLSYSAVNQKAVSHRARHTCVFSISLPS